MSQQTKSGNRKYVKLSIYQHQTEQVVIDTLVADKWEDFVIIAINGEALDPELHRTLAEYGKRTDKMLILVPKEMDLTFYGVEVEEEDDSQAVGEQS